MNQRELVPIHIQHEVKNHEPIWINMNWIPKSWIDYELKPEIMNWLWISMNRYETLWNCYQQVMIQYELIWIDVIQYESLSITVNHFNKRLLSTEQSSFQSRDDASAVFSDGENEGSASEAFKIQSQVLFNLRSVTHSANQSFLLRFNSHCTEQEAEGRLLPDPSFAISVSHLSRFNSHLPFRNLTPEACSQVVMDRVRTL